MQALSSNSHQALLDLARNSIKHFLKTGSVLSCAAPRPELEMHRGCFVTLNKHDALRGCIGTFDAEKPLFQNVIRMAVASAFQDVRFAPVTKEEIDDIRMEISILGQLEVVQSFHEIEIGKHGVYVKLGRRSGTYLPDVAVNQKWSSVEFITRCAREKAGLIPEECSRAEVFRYAVTKISE